MKIEIITYKCGGGDEWWTYSLLVNGEYVRSTPLIYRMYSKEKTALNNGVKLLNKKIKQLTNEYPQRNTNRV